MKKILLVLVLLTLSVFAKDEKMVVYKSPTCGCCVKWIDYLKENGMDVEAIEVRDVTPIKKKVGITPQTSSCHTAIIDGYVVEGHVNYSAIKKMLEEQPKILGLTVPGMPIGSPGMEQGNMKQAYNVYAIKPSGKLEVYEKH